jgi:4-diphosphocytidyl-2-C-methyl-D-erythritol kinase
MEQPHPWPAPAKLNLFLHITGQRSDGYHLLQTLFQFVDYCDLLYFEPRQDGIIRRIDNLPGIPEHEDLTIRAAHLLRKLGDPKLGVDIRIDKRLPMGGGLGGGSSDAATTLVALNQLWNLGLTTAELAELGLSLGADVPVFVYGSAAWAEGIGEQLEPVELPEPWYVVVIPAVSVPTAAIFQSPELTRDCTPITIRDFLNGAGTNVCEAPVRKRCPEVAEALDWLSRFGDARLTGTGSCIFAAFDEKAQADKVLAQLPPEWRGFSGRGRNHSPLRERLQEAL